MQRKYAFLQNQIHKLSTETNPLQLLKLLDPAQFELIQSFKENFSIKFRLCDEDALQKPQSQNFDPKIYFKVFLKQKIVDLSDTAPRNYAVEAETGVIDRRLWYARFTNQPFKRLNGQPLQSQKFQVKPFVSQQEVYELKKMKQQRWQSKMREDFLKEKFKIEEVEDTEVLEWCKQLDYFEYEQHWKQCGTLQSNLNFE